MKVRQFAIGFLLSSALLAQERLIVADASSSGTYKAMLGEIINVCSDDTFQIEEAKNITGGATDNLDALFNNKVSAAFLHSDVIYAMAQSDPAYRQLKTLVALYPEEIHVLALRNSKVSTGGVFGVGSKQVTFNSLADLRGYKVGAAGGGVITARILQGQGEGGFMVQELPSGADVMTALNAGTIQAAIYVGGAPLPNLTALAADQYKLLPIGESISGRVGGVYRPATINYRNLQSGAVKTMAATAILLTRKYTIAKMIIPQAKFRSCFYSHLDELKETPGNHPKWQAVDPADHGVWDWYELPNGSAPAKRIKP